MKGLMSLAVACISIVPLAACGGASNEVSPPWTSMSSMIVRQPATRPYPRKSSANEFLYVANYGSNNVTAYKINTKTGKLTRVKGSPFAAGTSPVALSVDPTANYVYVGNDGEGSCNSGSVSAYSISTSTGALTQLSGSPFGGLPCPRILTVTPNGAFLYGTNVNHYDSVSGYSIASNGTLTALPGSPFGTCGQPEGIATAPSGNFLYITCTLYTEYDGEIDAYTINQDNGALTQVSGSPYSTDLIAVPAVVPAGGYLFVPSDTYQADNYVLEYAIDTASGALSAVSGSPFPDGDETYPFDVAITPSSKFIYVANGNADNIAAYSISPSGGGLTPISGSPFEAGTTPIYDAVDTTGNFLYAVNLGSNNISAYVINQSNGKLTPVAGSPFAAGTSPYQIGIASP